MNSYRLTGIRILQGCGKIICKILKKIQHTSSIMIIKRPTPFDT